MKNLLLLLMLWAAGNAQAQVSGNINYQRKNQYLETKLPTEFANDADLVVRAKGLANIRADVYVAIFSLTQLGKTTEEVNQLIDKRISRALAEIEGGPQLETYVDMVSFVPIYEYEVEKKIFSKTTYNEVPAGFELKKNIHVRFSDVSLLNAIVAAFAKNEIYDLVRLDYFAARLDSVKRTLRKQAHRVLREKMEDYQSLLDFPLDSAEKQLSDSYKVMLPPEMYDSYQAFNNSIMQFQQSAKVTHARKSKTLYYQPVLGKDADFILNPVIVEPVIQVVYEVKLKVSRPETPPEGRDRYFIITPEGALKEMKLK
mgnify:CR=1 FL=1